MDGVSVAIVEDHLLAAEGLRLSFVDAGHQVEIWSPAELVHRLDHRGPAPHVVVLDLDLGHGLDGAAFIERIILGGSAVVVCTAATSLPHLGLCLARGAAAVLGKDSTAADVVDAVERAAAHEQAMCAAVYVHLLQAHDDFERVEQQRLAPFAALTVREREIFGLILDGVSATGIAECHGVSVKTVRHQIAAILQKLEVRSQLEAVALARRLEWVPPVPTS